MRDLTYIHSTSSLQYGHGPGAPTPGPGVDGHHHSSHHHRNHHHVVHRHGPPHPPSSLPSPVHPGSGGAPAIVHSPRSTRDYVIPGSSVVLHPTDGIMLSSSGNKPQPLPREREWSQTAIHHPPSIHDYCNVIRICGRYTCQDPYHPTSSFFVMTPASVPRMVSPPHLSTALALHPVLI